MPRKIEERIAWALAHRPDRRGLCAHHIWEACRIPLTHSPDATAAYRKAKAAGLVRQGPAPRGAIGWWTGGSRGHGHVAISAGGGKWVTTDAYLTGTRTGVRSGAWIRARMPLCRYKGWSWSFADTPIPRS
jgi:hypothetical protein